MRIIKIITFFDTVNISDYLITLWLFPIICQYKKLSSGKMRTTLYAYCYNFYPRYQGSGHPEGLEKIEENCRSDHYYGQSSNTKESYSQSWSWVTFSKPNPTQNFWTQPNPLKSSPDPIQPTDHRHLVWHIRLYRKLYTTTVTRQ